METEGGLVRKMTQESLNKVRSKRMSSSRVKIEFVLGLDIGAMTYLITHGPS